MSKENVTDYKIPKNSSQGKLTNAQLSDQIASSTEGTENPYLPKMRTSYAPSDESVESATGVDFPINMPNPAVDPIVANNISNAEFDYTQDMSFSEEPYSEKS